MTVSRLLSIIGGNEKRTPAVLEDMLKSLALPRKSSELETAEHDALLKAVESTTNEILRYTKTLYGGDEESRKSQHEMDQHWAAQKAAFQYFVAHKKEYLDFLPGRIFIYMQFAERILQYADKLESFVKKTTPNGAQIVELGSGSATLSHILVNKRSIGAHIVDLSEGALDYAQFLGENQFKTIGNIGSHRTDMFNFSWDEKYDLAMNSGVFEHLTIKEQEKLIHRMSDLIHDGGLVAIAVPNKSSPIYQAAREEESGKKWYEAIKSYLYPQPYLDPVNLRKLFKGAGLEILEVSGVSLAPSAVNRKLCERTADVYNGNVDKFNPASVEATITFWRQFEKGLRYEHPDMLEKFAWYNYAIGQKPIKSKD